MGVFVVLAAMIFLPFVCYFPCEADLIEHMVQQGKF